MGKLSQNGSLHLSRRKRATRAAIEVVHPPPVSDRYGETGARLKCPSNVDMDRPGEDTELARLDVNPRPGYNATADS